MTLPISRLLCLCAFTLFGALVVAAETSAQPVTAAVESKGETPAHKTPANNPGADPSVSSDAGTSVGSEFSCLPAQSAAGLAAGLIEKVELQYEKINDLRARFNQTSYFLGTDESKISSGEVFFLRPGRMDWVYGTPDTQRFVSDGQSVWWYQPDLSQVTIRRLDQSFVSDVPVSFLLGVGKLRESFKLESACGTSSGTLLNLLPSKPNASLERFLLLVDSKDASPKGARIRDVGGNETTILFVSPTFNKGVEAKRFAFEVPKGTDIIDERSKVGQPAAAKRPIIERDVRGEPK